MSRYAAFLRAVNVGGRASVGMADLCRAFTEAGCEEVRTVIQSGNVLFEAPRGLTPRLEGAILAGVRGLVGPEAAVCFRSLEAIRNLLSDSSFSAALLPEGAKLYVTFLAEPPRSPPALPISSEKEGLDVLALRNLDVFVVSRPLPRGMYGFPNAFVESVFGVPATTRNWNTVRRVAGDRSREKKGRRA
ncbi:MAG: DUF1697 domain-containing protein [Acidobacteriota bacterium]